MQLLFSMLPSFQHNHAYLKVFTKKSGFEKWALLLELLSNLTANMFLLAVVSLSTSMGHLPFTCLSRVCVEYHLISSTILSTLKTMGHAR